MSADNLATTSRSYMALTKAVLAIPIKYVVVPATARETTTLHVVTLLLTIMRALGACIHNI